MFLSLSLPSGAANKLLSGPAHSASAQLGPRHLPPKSQITKSRFGLLLGSSNAMQGKEEKERRRKVRLNFKSLCVGQATKEQTKTRFRNLTLCNLSVLERKIQEGDKVIYMLYVMPI